jgi:2-C-methyl-D-erythritol 4-phosphate cytidylyltransferase
LGIFTDDATVYEHQGWAVTLIEGNSENIKLTTPEDLAFAEFLMAAR